MDPYQCETIELEKVGCNGCFWEIQVGLEMLGGFKSMRYDVAAMAITVEYDERELTREAIEQKIEALGYRLKSKQYEEIGFWRALRRAFGRQQA